VWGSSRRRLAAARGRADREATARRRAHDEVADLQARIRIHAAARRIAERSEERARAELVATLRRLATLQDAGAREAARRSGGGR
jgi:hypothetical protein